MAVDLFASLLHVFEFKNPIRESIQRIKSDVRT